MRPWLKSVDHVDEGKLLDLLDLHYRYSVELEPQVDGHLLTPPLLAPDLLPADDPGLIQTQTTQTCLMPPLYLWPPLYL